jgi:hypothetical protein
VEYFFTVKRAHMCILAIIPEMFMPPHHTLKAIKMYYHAQPCSTGYLVYLNWVLLKTAPMAWQIKRYYALAHLIHTISRANCGARQICTVQLCLTLCFILQMGSRQSTTNMAYQIPASVTESTPRPGRMPVWYITHGGGKHPATLVATLLCGFCVVVHLRADK